MATQFQQAPGAEEEPLPGTEPGTEQQPGTEPGQEQEPEGDETPPEVAALAEQMGWVPKDKYTGPADNWKDARQFILDGRDIQRETSRELKALRTTLDTVSRTTGTLIERQVNERLGQLQARHAELVEAGDSDGALRIAEEITRTKATPTQPGVSPDAQSFAERNASWFNKPGSEYATSRAVEICNTLAAQGYSHADQLRICEQRMQQEMPQLFGKGMNGHQQQPQKAPPGVSAPGSRAPNGGGNREKGFADLPKAAQDIALDIEKRLAVPKEDYARNYFANLGKRA